MAEKKPRVEGDALSGKKAEIIIHKDSNKHAIDPVPIGLNGTMYTIRRGQKVVVPIEVVWVLEQAVETRYEQVMDERDKSVQLIPRDVMSYPFSVLSEVS